FRDHNTYIDTDANYDATYIYPNVQEQVSRDGAIYMVPRSLRVSLLSYNKDIWTANGLTAPNPDWTVQDMLGVAEQLAKKRGDKVEVYGLVDWGNALTAFFGELGEAGVGLVTTPPGKARLDRAEGAAAPARQAPLSPSGPVPVP